MSHIAAVNWDSLFPNVIVNGVSRIMAAPSSPPSRGRGPSAEMDFDSLKRLIHGKLVEKLDLSRLGDLQGETLRREIRLVIEHLCDTENALLNRSERERLIEEVLDETFGYGPLEILLKEQGVADIMINGPKNVFIEKNGRIQRSEVTFRDNAHLMQILDRIVSRIGRRVDETTPMVDARLPDGSRVNAIIPPLAAGRPFTDDSPFPVQNRSVGRPATIRRLHTGNCVVALKEPSRPD